MKRASIPMIALALVVASGGANSSAQSIMRTAILYPVADSTITSTAPDINDGSSVLLTAGVGSDGLSTNRALFQFDLSSIPTNATVSNAAVYLVGMTQPGFPTYFGLSVMLTNWSEAGVTWNSRSLSTPWNAPGGQSGVDFLSYVSAATVLNGPGFTNEFVDNGGDPDYGLAHDVQAWLSNPSQNFGWILAAIDETKAGSVITLNSREAPLNQPVLAVGYTAPFAPIVITAPGVANGQFCFTFHIETNHGYQILATDDIHGTNWQVRLVLDPSPVSQDAVFCDTVSSSNRFYRVRTE